MLLYQVNNKGDRETGAAETVLFIASQFEKDTDIECPELIRWFCVYAGCNARYTDIVLVAGSKQDIISGLTK